MAIRGRKPKPVGLKVLTGNPGKRPLPDSEPEPGPAAPLQRPKFLRGRAAQLWDEYAPNLVEIGVLTPDDADMFAVWCRLMAEFQRDPRNMTASRISQMRALANEFGLTPSSRTRVPRTKPTKQRDKAEDYFGAAG